MGRFGARLAVWAPRAWSGVSAAGPSGISVPGTGVGGVCPHSALSLGAACGSALSVAMRVIRHVHVLSACTCVSGLRAQLPYCLHLQRGEQLAHPAENPYPHQRPRVPGALGWLQHLGWREPWVELLQAAAIAYIP